MGAAVVRATDPAEADTPLDRIFGTGDYRWAIYDRKTRTLYFGPRDVHIHLTVAELSGVLRNPPSYYRPGANILGGYVCRSKQGFFYFDPYSGTFPGTIEGVQEAEAALAEVCRQAGIPIQKYEEVPPEAWATSTFEL